MANTNQNSTSDVVLLQDTASATGNGLTLNVLPYSTVVVELTISTTATVTFEGATHTVFSSITATNMATVASAVTATVTGLYQLNVAGLATVRARISAYTSGTVTAVARASTASKGYQ